MDTIIENELFFDVDIASNAASKCRSLGVQHITTGTSSMRVSQWGGPCSLPKFAYVPMIPHILIICFLSQICLPPTPTLNSLRVVLVPPFSEIGSCSLIPFDSFLRSLVLLNPWDTLIYDGTEHSINELRHETARAKYNLVLLVAIHCKITTTNCHFFTFYGEREHGGKICLRECRDKHSEYIFSCVTVLWNFSIG